MKKLLLTILLAVTTLSAKSQKLDVLQNALKEVNLTELCTKEYRPYPAYTDRKYWESLNETVRKQAIADGEKTLNYEWKTVSLTSYLDFPRKGIRQPNDQHIAEKHSMLSAAVLAELVEGKGRFIDVIVNGVWSLCEQSTWVAAAHIPNQASGIIPDVNKRTIDLIAGEIGNALSWTHYFFAEQLFKISPLITKRIEDELNNHIINIFQTRKDLWWEANYENAFVNNWNVWCNFNVLTTIILVEKDPVRKEQLIRKSMRSVDQFINYYGEDGGCEEGATYWDHAGGKLMEYLSLVKSFTNGQINAFENQRVKNIGLYIARAHIDSLLFVNFADAEARAQPIPMTIFRYGLDIKDQTLSEFGSYIAKIANFKEKPLRGGLDMKLWQCKLYDTICKTPSKAPFYQSVFLPDVEFMMVRTKGGSPEGFTLAAKGGFNEESHNHNDAGSFILYRNSIPVIIDAGVGTYIAKTFSPQRYEIWTMQSQYHNLPVINGIGQKNGKDFKATELKYNDTPQRMTLSMELANAYPKEANCKSWRRTFDFNRKTNQITLTETFDLNEVSKEPTSLTLISVGKVTNDDKQGSVELTYQGETIVVRYNHTELSFSKETVTLDDPRLTKIWGTELNRISFTLKNPKTKGEVKLKFETKK